MKTPVMAGNLGRHYYKKPIAALTFADINMLLGIFTELMPRNGGVLVEHCRNVSRAKMI
jgi:hypothetical protein